MKFLFYACLLMLCAGVSHAIDRPNTGTLMRVDTRPPDEIFRVGFSPFGRNNSVRDHARGVSCVGRNEDSAFISTTTDPEYAGNYARRLLSLTGRPAYVYLIDSTDNFYNMATSLNNIGYTAGIHDARQQSEWISDGAIPADSIRGVRVYTTNASPPIISNPGYVFRPPSINDSPYISRGQHLPGSHSVLANMTPLVGACMSASVYCRTSKRGDSATAHTRQTCSHVEPYSTNWLPIPVNEIAQYGKDEL